MNPFSSVNQEKRGGRTGEKKIKPHLRKKLGNSKVRMVFGVG